MVETFLVSYDHENKVMIVGQKDPKAPLDVINALKGPKASELYEKLTSAKKTSPIMTE